jgi:hypothetical protein
MKRSASRALVVAGVAIAHALLTVALVVYVFGAGMARFDTGGEPSFVERVASTAAGVLGFPLVTAAVALFPGPRWPHGFPYDHLLFLANGLVWALGIVALWDLARRPARTRARQGPCRASGRPERDRAR